jgi:hypothetical protein
LAIDDPPPAATVPPKGGSASIFAEDGSVIALEGVRAT